MSNETHQDTRDALVLLKEGLLRGDEELSVRSHLTECQACQAYLDELDKRDSVFELMDPGELLAQLPEREDDHASTETLWQLADSAAAAPSPEALDTWAHVLNCRRCYLGLVRCRELLEMEIAIDRATVARVSQAAIEKWRKVQLTILLSFAAVQHDRLRIRIGPTMTSRKSSRSSSLRNYHGLVRSDQEETAAVERNLNERWEHTHHFGHYRFKLILIPQRAEQEQIEVRVKVESLPATKSDRSLCVTLRSFDAREIVRVPLRSEELLLSVLPLGHYSIDFADDGTNELLGTMELLPEAEYS